jgi:phage tail sheath protein FI
MAYLHGVETIELPNGLRPIALADASVIGLVGTANAADPAAFPEQTPVLLTRMPAEDDIGLEGELPVALRLIFAQGSARVVVIRVPYIAGAGQADEIVGLQADPDGNPTGLWALTAAAPVLGVGPRIVVAPGWSAETAVHAEMRAVAAKLRGIAIVDSPGGDAGSVPADYTEAIAHVTDGNQRTYHVWPHLTMTSAVGAQSIHQPASAAVAGVMARVDTDKGIWHSPSNHEIYGVVGPRHPVEFRLNDTATLANVLNENNVATIIRRNGIRLWGNRVPAVDSLWAFVSVRRTADVIEDSIEAAQMWAMDRPFSAQLLIDIRESVRAFLRSMTAQGAILGGDVWLDPELNTATTLAAGQLYVNYDFEPPAPLERLTFRAARNGDYYTDLIAQVVGS